MAITRSMTKKLKICSSSDIDGSTDNDGLKSWSNLNHDLLFLIMTYMGVFDFIAVSRVCKSWREVALDSWNRFMVSKQPMVLSISTRLNKKDCYLEDYTRRKLKITIPHSNGRDCLGVTCGYLIFYGRKTRDFWLVNPFTTKELYFLDFPFGERIYSHLFRGILVFSPSMSGWVFVVSNLYTNVVSFSLAGEQARWRSRSISSGSCIHDLHLFKGKLYIIDSLNHLWELRLNPEPTLTLHKMKNLPRQAYSLLEFVRSGENLYVWDYAPYMLSSELDFYKMKWVRSETKIREYAVFVDHFAKGSVAIKPSTWTHPWTQYKSVNYTKDKIMGRCETATMWYYPHECLKNNDWDMENGAMLNTLEE